MLYRLVFNMHSGNALKCKPRTSIDDGRAELAKCIETLKNNNLQFYELPNGIIRTSHIESVFIEEMPASVVDSNLETKYTD